VSLFQTKDFHTKYFTENSAIDVQQIRSLHMVLKYLLSHFLWILSKQIIVKTTKYCIAYSSCSSGYNLQYFRMYICAKCKSLKILMLSVLSVIRFYLLEDNFSKWNDKIH